MPLTLDGTNGITQSTSFKSNTYLDAAGGNTATINGILPIAIGDVPAGGTGLTLLGTIATTSGSSVTLSGLTLTSYKQLQFILIGISGTATSSNLRLNSERVTLTNIDGVGDISSGGGTIDLATGIFWGSSGVIRTGNHNYLGSGGASGLTTASTSITFTIDAGTFDAGSIKIYGVK
jgi:hypothetical protein